MTDKVLENIVALTLESGNSFALRQVVKRMGVKEKDIASHYRLLQMLGVIKPASVRTSRKGIMNKAFCLDYGSQFWNLLAADVLFLRNRYPIDKIAGIDNIRVILALAATSDGIKRREKEGIREMLQVLKEESSSRCLHAKLMEEIKILIKKKGVYDLMTGEGRISYRYLRAFFIDLGYEEKTVDGAIGRMCNDSLRLSENKEYLFLAYKSRKNVLHTKQTKCLSTYSL